MRILITNDDGTHAEGLAVLERIARAISDDVWVVAPETDQSGKAHSLTLTDPLRIRAIDDRHFAVRGTPTDCVILGVHEILPGRPDLVLSGVNRGANVADDVTYSGTIAAAMEGTLLGIPSIAMSQMFRRDDGPEPRWDCAEAHGAAVIRRLVEAGFAEGTLINVNFPPCDPSEVTGTEITVQGVRGAEPVHVDKRQDMRGNDYYWIAFRSKLSEHHPPTDLWALGKRAISVTPLRLDLTDHEARDRLKHAFR